MASAQADQDLKEMLADELNKINDALIAPSKPFVRNFEAQTEEEKVRAPNSANVQGGFSLSQ